MITSLPDAGIATNTGPVCIGANVQLEVQDVFGATYAWTGPNAFSSTIRNPLVAVPDSGTYTVVVTVNNCASTYETFVDVYPSPVLILMNDTTVALGQSIQLWASGGLTYDWSPAANLDNPAIGRCLYI